ncbi:GPI inositol-deacylase isoform X5 [Hydra vulgaris]|uniref:GPI inositol-deacylase n=1 Tax=Hydra vulgaris TaxID=6087 RepID=A0ABM4BTV0_HYDVU
MFFYNQLGIVIAVAFLSVALYDISYKVEENRCGMTWMYEQPEFIKLTMPNVVQHEFAKYSLFIYGEGSYATYLKNMQGKYKLDGVPVLFVHGNGGSYKQVRSLGSVSLRKSEKSVHHFNYFSVDFKEELSALYGPFLYRQTKFLQHAITQIFNCYSHLPVSLRPTSIIAVGHSMGGVVIRGLYTLSSFDASLINTIISLATPQKEAPLFLDNYIYEFYKEVNNYWIRESNGKLFNTTFLSIAGGFRDYLVRSDLCFIKTLNKNQRYSLTTSIPHIWRSTDHQCIVWCNELVRALTRCFFKMIAFKTKQVSKSHSRRLKVFDSIFFNADLKHSAPRNNCVSIQVENTMSSFHANKSCFNLYSIHGHGIILSSEGSLSEWVLLCDNSACVFPYYTFPTHKKSSFYFYVNSSVTILNGSNKEVFVQAYDETNFFSVNIPFLLNEEKLFHFQKSFFIKINLIGFIETWQAYKLTFNNNYSFQATVGLFSPFTSDIEYFLLNGSESISLKLFKGKPYNKYYDKHVYLMIWSENISSINVRIQPDFVAIFGQIFKFNYAKILRITILFCILKSLAEFSKLGQFNVFQSTLFVVSLTLLMLSTRLLFKFDIDVITRAVWIETFLVFISFFLSGVWHSLVKKFIIALCVLLTPLVSVTELDQMKFTKFMLLATISTLSVLTVYQYIFFGMPFLFFIMINIIKINASEDCEIKKVHMSILAGILPSIIILLVVPTIIYVKDCIESTSSLEGASIYILCLHITYALYLIVHLSVPKIRTKYVYFMALVILTILSETFQLFNQVYITIFFLIYISSFSLIKKFDFFFV